MSSINVELLLQTDTEKDKLLIQMETLHKRLDEIKIIRARLPEHKKALPDLEDITITHNLFISKTYVPPIPIAFVYAKASLQNRDLSFGSSLLWKIPKSGSFIGDAFINFKFSAATTNDTLLAANVQRDAIRYCAMPCAKLVKKSTLLLDSSANATVDRMNFVHYLDHELPKDKLLKTKQALGQEKKYESKINPLPGYTQYGLKRKYTMGAQTFKVAQDPLNMFYPLIFWFSTNPGQPLVNKISDNLNIKVDLELASSLIEFMPRPGSTGVINYPVIEAADLYYKDIYVSHSIYEIYANMKYFEIISCWKYQEFPLTKTIDDLPLNLQDWPLERIYLSFIPDTNDSQNWYRGYALTTTLIPDIITYVNPLSPPQPNPTYLFDTYLVPVDVESMPIDSLTVTTYGVTYYQDFGADFFVNYETDFNEKISVGKNGSLMINFSYLGGKKGIVSGYSSTANNTDFRIKYKSSYFNPNVPTTGKLFLSAKVINSLMIDPKVLQIRYS